MTQMNPMTVHRKGIRFEVLCLDGGASLNRKQVPRPYLS
jgi:hypothetical protein